MPKNLIGKWIVDAPENIERCIIAFPGRGGSAESMMSLCRAIRLPDTLIICLQSRYFAWYASPNGANDQYDAVQSMKNAIKEITNTINKIKDFWGVSDNQIALLGHSAGSVVSIQTALNFNFRAVISLAGAILEPEKMPICAIDTQFLLQHDTNDDCFSWDERFVPMHDALKTNKYHTEICIDRGNGHDSFTNEVVDYVQSFLTEKFKITAESEES